ncbi:rRNA maturation RNase YbeY [Algoriphagus alkaliphilus]|uniref:Endoribonuclease YbeY n=1 Tax=Algoriphagus alkaliphilus TaxID=279824 RepID=A0A1G5V0E5_9BACT|nr:rRNA maturation RNase YbeY [Algoriphagus alkaliphilus]MBA4300658.1 rRNA maturation RNase YbeY [Cyclobacterium sp.]SDA39361.1 rRNA maturation RNase YbeY [Algoriphagus alkaliphilus]
MAVNFFSEEIKFDLPQKLKRKAWLKKIAQSENFKLGELNYIFCSDEYLYQINVDYLNHHTYTDIITFDNSEEEETIEGDIFISIDRVKENATNHQENEESELSRVLSHGIFHLMGYKDKSKEQAELMRSKEAFAIKLYENS